MAGAGEKQAAPPGDPPAPPPLDPQAMDAAASGLDHHRKVGDDDGASFRMENLSEEIQTIVISFLPLKEAVKTSSVERCWRMLWRFHTNLCFKAPNYLDCDSHDYHAIVAFKKTKRAKFVEDVNWVIQHHSGIGINKFSIRCDLHMENFDHVDRWIGFAASSKATVIEFDLKKLKDVPSCNMHRFPLEALHVQGISFVQSLLLADVSIKPPSDMHGFTVLRRLVMDCVKILGDFPGLLANCSALDELHIIKCIGVTNLSIPHQLHKLQHLVIEGMDVKLVEFHAAGLAHFVYKGREIPIILHGCSKLEKATMFFQVDQGLGRVFTVVPSILHAKILNVRASILGYEQLQKLTTRSHGTFIHLRHMTCELLVLYTNELPNEDNGVLQLAHCLNIAPQLETLHLDMIYMNRNGRLSDEMVVVEEEEEEEDSPMCRHDYLKTVYISGFRLYRAQKMLVCHILENAPLLEHMQLGARCTNLKRDLASLANVGFEKKFIPQVHEWALLTSLRFGKVVTAIDAPPK